VVCSEAGVSPGVTVPLGMGATLVVQTRTNDRGEIYIRKVLNTIASRDSLTKLSSWIAGMYIHAL